MKNFKTIEDEKYDLLDKQTGEIIKHYHTIKVSLDEYIMVFFYSYPEIFKLEGNALKVLMCAWKTSSYNNSLGEGNTFVNNISFKEYVRQSGLNLADKTINAYITQLAKRNIIINKCRGMYMLNPNYFFKGTLNNRSDLILQIKKVSGEQNDNNK